MSLRAWIGRLVRRLRSAPPIDVLEATQSEQIAGARRKGHRVVFGDFVGVFTIDDAGTPYFSVRTDLADCFEVDDARLRNVVWHQAAMRYPRLRYLDPIRRPADYDCPSCAGTGRVRGLPPRAEDKLICTCGGLGWLPAGYVDPTLP
jgi:hypothetical protein